ncbi:MAG: DUF4926 domain-containing protein [Anaerolineae bacterium]|nr:DUF4926 domain-containing protein [Anaerolineae bacterium]
MIQELDRVALTVDLPEHQLKVGDIGMIVHIYADHKGYEIEFVTLSGDFVALVSVYPDQIRQIDQGEIANARRLKTA